MVTALRLSVLAAWLALTLATAAQGSAVLYNQWFSEARCALRSVPQGDSVAHWLVLTYDEGNVTFPRGSRLVLRLQGGIEVTLATDREPTRADVLLRRYADHTDRLITCHYPITEAQLALLHDHDLRQLRIETAQGWLTRRTPRHLRLR